MHSGDDPVIPDCKNFNNTRAIQLVGSGDRLGSGIMQLTGANFKQDFATNNFLSVRDTIHDGMAYFIDTFKHALRKSPQCIQNKNGTINYQSLVRGSWAAYNGGPEAFCRFSNPKAKWHENDIGFKEDFDLVLASGVDSRGHKLESYYQHYLKDTANENMKAAFDEIINNFKNGKNNTNYLNTVLLAYVEPFNPEEASETTTPSQSQLDTVVIDSVRGTMFSFSFILSRIT